LVKKVGGGESCSFLAGGCKFPKERKKIFSKKNIFRQTEIGAQLPTPCLCVTPLEKNGSAANIQHFSTAV